MEKSMTSGVCKIQRYHTTRVLHVSWRTFGMVLSAVLIAGTMYQLDYLLSLAGVQ